MSARLGDGTLAVLAGHQAQQASNVLLLDADLTSVLSFGVTANWWGRDVAGITLPNGNVLLVDGGYETVYDYRARQTLTTENALSPDYIRWATLLLLRSGQVLVSGGFTADFNPLSQWAIYDPATNTFVEFGEMTKGRANHTATELMDGRILIAGGRGADYPHRAFNSAEILDLNTKQAVVLKEHMSHCRSKHAAALLPDGRVLMVGGYWPKQRPGYNHICEIFDPESMAFRDAAALGRGRVSPVLWSCGKNILVIGGDKNSRVVEIYDTSRDRFFMNPELLREPRGAGFTVTPLPGNVAVVVGGRVNDTDRVLSSIETITRRAPFSLRTPRRLPKEASSVDAVAVVCVYDGGQFRSHFPVFDFSGIGRELWPHLSGHDVLRQLQVHITECSDPSVTVSFAPEVSYEERVNLLHLVGISEVPSITVTPDWLRRRTIRQFIGGLVRPHAVKKEMDAE